MLNRELFCLVYDVQHGSATYMKTPVERHIIFDLGTGSIKDKNLTFSPLLHLKNRWGVEELDEVIITHPHRDHIDDIFNFDKLSPKVLHRPKHLTEAEIRGDSRNSKGEQRKIDKYLEIHRRYSQPVGDGESPTDSANNGGIDFQFFTPTKCPRDNINNHSIVTVVSYLGWKMIVPGDNETQSWEELLERKDFREAIKGTMVLMASHHGRENGFCENLFKYITPRLVIVSDGPVGTTSITDKYYNVTTEAGWNVTHTDSGETEQRWVLTTRNDKSIRMRVGYEYSKPVFGVEID
jgi:competence protein ComEC